MSKRLLYTLACIALLVTGCGGGGGGGGEDPLAALEGRWLGPTLGGSLLLAMDAAGAITQVVRDEVDGGLTGTFRHVSGGYYEGQLSDTTAIRLFLGSSGRHAAYFADLDLASLQRDVATLPAGGFQVADVAPDGYTGSNLRLDAQARVDSVSEASAAIAGDGSFNGSDSSGLVFGSPAATALAPDRGILVGPYEDSAHATVGFMDVLPSPDGQFLVSASFPVTNSTFLNAEFIGAWDRD